MMMSMIFYLIKRSLISFVVLSGSFGVIYALAASLGDPLADIKLSRAPNMEYLLIDATRKLRLDESIPERFFGWYLDVFRSIATGEFTLGTAINGRPVSEGLWTNVAPTFLLVSLSIALSLLTGAILGVFVAMKRSGFREPIVNLFSFIGYVTPVFWIGHLGKQYVVIIANNNAEEIVSIANFLAFFAGSGLFLIGTVLAFLSFYSFEDKRAKMKFSYLLLFALPLMAVLGQILPAESSYRTLFIFGVVSIGGWVLLWRLLGSGMPRIVWFGFRYGFIWFSSFIVQKLILTLPEYMRKEEIGGRPFPSFGYESAWYEKPDFWILQLDRMLHLLLPIIAITCTTVAIYYQVTKTAAIEALDSDYVRQARAKGVSELEVLVRHVFRNCYLSLVNTFVPNYLYLMNAVIIIELVFGFQGLGIFIFSSIYSYDLNRLMGGVFVLGIATFIGMLLSDLVSTRIDPRIRQFR
jgi:peptide/nickel transport system permease protein